MRSRQLGPIGPGAGTAERPDTGDLSLIDSTGRPLQINVPFTTPDGTIAALRSVLELGTGVGVRVTLWMFYVVPYTLPLDRRAIAPGYVAETTRALTGAVPLDIRVVVHPCRGLIPAACESLPPHSVVFIGGRNHWWPSEAQRLAARLRKNGHQVFFVESR
jgi:hypothetical protein